MSATELQPIIDAAWDARDGVNSSTTGEVRDAVVETLDMIDSGTLRVAAKENGEWVVHQWAKKAVLLSFRLFDNAVIGGGPGQAVWWDKVASKFDGWGPEQFGDAGFRAVPGAIPHFMFNHSAQLLKW